MKNVLPFFTPRNKPVPKVVTPEALKQKTLNVVNKSFQVVVGKNEQEQKRWCAARLREVLETVDNLIPVVGAFMDLPVVDEAEHRIIEQLVDWGWEEFHKSKRDSTLVKIDEECSEKK